jgi:hypothetical protein
MVIRVAEFQGGLQNKIDFWPFNEIMDILSIDIMVSRQKLGIISEDKVCQKLQL